MTFSATILGLAISDRGICCAQLSGGAKPLVQKLARFPIPANLSLEQPEALGQQLQAFLRGHGLKASRAVIGVPARWLVAQEKEVPPLQEQAAYATLRLQAERISEADGGELIFDVAGRPDAEKPARVLLVGMLRKQVDRITRLCAAAELTPLTITSTSLVLSHLPEAAQRQPVVLLSAQGAELVWQTEAGPRMLRHLACPQPAGAFPVSLLSGELRRAMALAPPAEGKSSSLLLWEDVGLSQQDLGQLSDRLGMNVQRGQTLDALHAEVSPTALNGSGDAASAETFLPAVALAMSRMASHRPPVDFLHSRLAPPPVRRIGRRTLWIAAAATLAVLVIGGLYYDVQSREATAYQLEAELDRQSEGLAAAEARLDRFSYGRGYFEARPPVLDCLREITLSIRRDDPLWITSFTFRDNGRGQIQGRAGNQQVVLSVLDRLQQNDKFTNVQTQDLREAAGASRDTTFSISFAFTGGQP